MMTSGGFMKRIVVDRDYELQKRLGGLVAQTLEDSYRKLGIWYRLHEEGGSAAGELMVSIKSALIYYDGTPREHLCVINEADGVGPIDALFGALLVKLVSEYPSLKHINFVGFNVSGEFEESITSPGTEAMVATTLKVENSKGTHFRFVGEQSTSANKSSILALVKAIEYFINAEKAVLRVHSWILDAKERERPEQAETFTQRLAELVKLAGDYSNVVGVRTCR